MTRKLPEHAEGVCAALRGVMGIYTIRNTIDGRLYIGSSVDVGKRLRAHFLDLRRGYHTNQLLHADGRRYGVGAFAAELLEPVAVRADLGPREQANALRLIESGSLLYNRFPAHQRPANVVIRLRHRTP